MLPAQAGVRPQPVRPQLQAVRGAHRREGEEGPGALQGVRGQAAGGDAQEKEGACF